MAQCSAWWHCAARRGGRHHKQHCTKTPKSGVIKQQRQVVMDFTPQRSIVCRAAEQPGAHSSWGGNCAHLPERAAGQMYCRLRWSRSENCTAAVQQGELHTLRRASGPQWGETPRDGCEAALPAAPLEQHCQRPPALPPPPPLSLRSWPHVFISFLLCQ